MDDLRYLGNMRHGNIVTTCASFKFVGYYCLTNKGSSNVCLVLLGWAAIQNVNQ